MQVKDLLLTATSPVQTAKHTALCPMCYQYVHPGMLIGHVPRCYVRFTLAQGVIPLCTCMTCKAQRQHPGDLLPGATTTTSTAHGKRTKTGRKRPRLTLKQKQKEEEEEGERDAEEDADAEGLLLPKQSEGKHCCRCNARTKSCSTVHLASSQSGTSASPSRKALRAEKQK